MKEKLAGLILLTLVAAAVVKFWAEAGNSAGETNCWFDHSKLLEVTCHYVAVPAFLDGQSDELLLPVAVMGMKQRQSSSIPVVVINGRSGAGAFGSSYPETDTMNFWFDLLWPMFRECDVMLYDQRGFGLAEPGLNCPEVDELAKYAERPFDFNFDDQKRENNALSNCAWRLQNAEVDVAMLSTLANADDLSHILAELGYANADLWSFSYGKRLALEIMRFHPEQIRSGVLDGVGPPHINTAEASPRGTATAFRQLFDDCADSSACDEA